LECDGGAIQCVGLRRVLESQSARGGAVNFPVIIEEFVELEKDAKARAKLNFRQSGSALPSILTAKNCQTPQASSSRNIGYKGQPAALDRPHQPGRFRSAWRRSLWRLPHIKGNRQGSSARVYQDPPLYGWRGLPDVPNLAEGGAISRWPAYLPGVWYYPAGGDPDENRAAGSNEALPHQKALPQPQDVLETSFNTPIFRGADSQKTDAHEAATDLASRTSNG